MKLSLLQLTTPLNERCLRTRQRCSCQRHVEIAHSRVPKDFFRCFRLDLKTYLFFSGAFWIYVTFLGFVACHLTVGVTAITSSEGFLWVVATGILPVCSGVPLPGTQITLIMVWSAPLTVTTFDFLGEQQCILGVFHYSKLHGHSKICQLWSHWHSATIECRELILKDRLRQGVGYIATGRSGSIGFFSWADLHLMSKETNFSKARNPPCYLGAVVPVPASERLFAAQPERITDRCFLLGLDSTDECNTTGNNMVKLL